MSNPIVLIDGMCQEESSGDGYRVVKLAADPVRDAIARAVIQNHPRPEPLEWSEHIGQKFTMAFHGTNMMGASGVNAEEVSLFQGTRGVGKLPKGKRTKGFLMQNDRLLDFEPGYNKVGVLQERIAATRATLPELEPLTREHLLTLPVDAVNSEGYTSDCTLAIFGTWRSPDGSECADAVWLCCGYDPEDDILDNVLYVRPEVGFSEHGSDYGQNFLNRSCGVVVGFKPITFKAALDLTGADHDDVLAMLRAPATV